MKIHPEAVAKAKIKVQEHIDFEFCVKNRVCPECTSDLECSEKTVSGYNRSSIRQDYKCTKCDFKYSE